MISCKKTARDNAIDIIMDVLEKEKMCHIAIKEALDEFDKSLEETKAENLANEKAFINVLVKGTVEKKITLDYIINKFSKTKISKMKPLIRNLLRMSVYQIVFMDSIPDSAACNEAVKIAKKRKFTNLSAFINGVLRNISREKNNIEYPDEKNNLVEALSVKYSVPQWIIDLFLEEKGFDETKEILSNLNNDNKYIHIRINISKSNIYEVKEYLEAYSKKNNLKTEILEEKCANNMLKISGFSDITKLQIFKDGKIQVQNVSSALVGQISGVKATDFCIDLCSAPGGKSMHIADLMNFEFEKSKANGINKAKGRIISCDVSESKTKLILNNVRRNGFDNIEVKVNDATVLKEEWKNTANLVIADVPCSGLGVIGHKPDIKYRVLKEDIDSLSEISKKIVKNAYSYLKEGGVLIFSTCTMTKKENCQLRDYIIQKLKMKPVDITDNLCNALLLEKDNKENSKNGFLDLSLTDSHDGFFIAKFIK